MPTIRDVAKKAGVGVATVSRFIAQKGSISAKASVRIQKAIEELQYRPSHIARALPAGMTQTIGIYLPFIYGAFYAPLLHYICTALEADGLRMMVAIGSNELAAREEVIQGVQFLSDHGCDGLLVMASALEAADFDEVLGHSTHTVFLNRTASQHRKRCFLPDHRAAGRLAAATLWEAGHRKIAVIGGNTFAPNNTARLRGFMEELSQRGADVGRIPTVPGHFSPEGGKSAAATLLAAHHGFTAVFCANDESASGALAHFYQEGIAVPGDISVLGYDGLDLANCTAPPLTTIRLPWDEICVSAVNHLLNERYGRTLPVKRTFKATVLWQKSLARIVPESV